MSIITYISIERNNHKLNLTRKMIMDNQNIPSVGDRVKLVANGSFTMPKVCKITDNDVVLQRKYKGRERGTLTVPKYRVSKLNKSFRGADFACVVMSKI